MHKALKKKKTQKPTQHGVHKVLKNVSNTAPPLVMAQINKEIEQRLIAAKNYSMQHATWHCARRPGRLLQRNTHLHKHTEITHSAKQGARRREPPLNGCASQFQALIKH